MADLPSLSPELRRIDAPSHWDALVADLPQAHFLQSYEWGQFKSHFGWSVERWAQESGRRSVAAAQVLFRRTPLGTMAYVPRGPLVALDDEVEARPFLSALLEVARRRRAIFIKMEPSGRETRALLSAGFRPSPLTIQPKTTMVVDLTPDISVIASAQKPKTRYNIGLAARKGVQVTEGGTGELPIFYRLLRETGTRDDFPIHSRDYYEQAFRILGDKLRLFLASYQGEILAGIIVAIFGREAIYLYGASASHHRQLMPNYLLQWEAMKWAKGQGCTSYDLWGIPDEAPGTSLSEAVNRRGGLWGVYRFKQGFGGNLVVHGGALDYVCSPARYWLWTQIAPRLQRLLGGWGGGF
ncbi:MAG: peptidoglycan bridge formation glycyltransferase FemA/FemB family protein [Chloroflexi bacterium]|nr:peptidoglycan bridge formation glycyltransferase FemA/FemB family protein [Chloroflexota bacterium]